MAKPNQINRKSPRDVAESFTKAEVTATVDQHPGGDARGWRITGFVHPTDNPVFKIKYGNNAASFTDSQARTHHFAYDSLRKVPQQGRQGTRISEIYRVIQTADNWTYTIMEYIRGKTLVKAMEDGETFKNTHLYYHGSIERAVKLLLAFPVPEDATPGSYGGGIIRQPLFKDYRAMIQYDSIGMLEKHLNKVSTIINKAASTVTFERDLHFVFSDLYEGNFKFTDDGDTYSIDFEQSNFVPLSFMTYATMQARQVACPLRRKLDLPQENLPVMKHMCGLFVMSWTKIGLPL
ncbi:hypothetical protein B0J13DRAFT_529014 [Dactylonectria estremocensis]|uniref:Aminoglycoside phosphotransferase domain-containing protein n=1 Tax=Dactylonectria estremocensis TaxID=1079267 RepID=A0A9P9IW15_9HYPO|nr:hypothetical protein B0J13DRAFT_529014 [Dactylonectria estremocensis]